MEKYSKSLENGEFIEQAVNKSEVIWKLMDD